MDGSGGLASLVSVLGALLLLAGGAFFLLKGAKPFPGAQRNAAASPIKMVRSVAVGQRERVTLISYRGEVFMLGVTAGGISLIARMDEEALPEGEEAHIPTPWLADRIRAVLTPAAQAPFGPQAQTTMTDDAETEAVPERR